MAARCCSARSPFLRSLISISMFTAPISVPEESNSGVGYGANGTRLPSGRSATASTPRTGFCVLSAIAIGHSSSGSGVPSGQNSLKEPHQCVGPSAGSQPQRSAAAWLK